MIQKDYAGLLDRPHFANAWEISAHEPTSDNQSDEDNMLNSRNMPLLVAATALCVSALLTGHSMTVTVHVDGTPMEGIVLGNNVVIADYPIANNQIDVTAVEGRQVDVLFDAVDLSVGEMFEATGRDSDGRELASLELEQTAETTTDVSISLAPVMDRLASNFVTLRARTDDGVTKEIVVPASETIKIGQVDATSSAWAKTYHLVCIEGECSLAVDPDETVVTFTADPSETVPFRFLEVDFSVKH